MRDVYPKLGCKVVGLTTGETGACVAAADRRVCLAADPILCVDTIGAGDTFCGAFLARTLAGDDPVQAVRYAGAAVAH